MPSLKKTVTRKRQYYFALLVALSFLFSSLPAAAITTVTVYADSSISAAAIELARSYSRKRHVVVNTSFIASERQQMQILDGAAADVLITPKANWIESLKTQGLIDIYSQIPIARNRLALVGPINSKISARLSEKFPTSELIREFHWDPSLLVGNPENLLEGVYGKEALRHMKIAGDMEEFTLYIKHLDQMQAMIRESGMYGIMFYSSTFGEPGMKVIDLFPENTHSPIEYHAVAIAGDNMSEARKFIKYLQSGEAKAILRNNGFSVE